MEHLFGLLVMALFLGWLFLASYLAENEYRKAFIVLVAATIIFSLFCGETGSTVEWSTHGGAH